MLDMDDHFASWNAPADFIDKTQLGGIPRHGIGRNLKVSKEEIVALLTALDLFASGAYDAGLSTFRSYLEAIAAGLRGLPVSCEMCDEGVGEVLPILEIALDETRFGKPAY